jgi:hypothetical protein
VLSASNNSLAEGIIERGEIDVERVDGSVRFHSAAVLLVVYNNIQLDILRTLIVI